MLKKREQELLVSMLEKPITFKTQKVYKNTINFYEAIWKLRDMDLVENKDIVVNGRKVKEWYLKLDGIFMAKILEKGGKTSAVSS